MQETGNNTIDTIKLTIRISKNSLSFTTFDYMAKDSIIYKPYILKSGVSIAANMREAFKSGIIIKEQYQSIQILIDTPILIIPSEIFNADDIDTMYRHSFPDCGNNCIIMYNVLPDINAVAVFNINKDLKLVIEDNLSNVKYITCLAPVWKQLHIRCFTGIRKKLYGYFHDNKLDIFSFNKNRFKFYNSFIVSQSKDALYFLLYVWKEIGFDARHDEMHIVGDIPDREWLISSLHEYLKNAYIISPTADYNRAPVSLIKGMPYDLMTLLIKGR